MNNLALERAKRDLIDAMQRYNIPEYMREPTERYLLNGIKPGSFLQHVIDNNLIGSCNTADADNIKLLRDYCMLMYWHFPPEAYGNTQRRRDWCKHGGLSGLLDREAAHA